MLPLKGLVVALLTESAVKVLMLGELELQPATCSSDTFRGGLEIEPETSSSNSFGGKLEIEPEMCPSDSLGLFRALQCGQ